MTPGTILRFLTKGIIATHRPWLEEVKNSKGNTEANTLKKATKINQFGIYELSLRELDPNVS